MLAAAAQLAWRARSRLAHASCRDLDGELWLPLVDEPIGSIVDADPGASDPELAALVARRAALLAFRTFAYIRVGHRARRSCSSSTTCRRTTAPRPGSSSSCASPAHREQIAQEVRAVADEIAADPQYADEEQRSARTRTPARASASSPESSSASSVDYGRRTRRRNDLVTRNRFTVIAE